MMWIEDEILPRGAYQHIEQLDEETKAHIKSLEEDIDIIESEILELVNDALNLLSEEDLHRYFLEQHDIKL